MFVNCRAVPVRFYFPSSDGLLSGEWQVRCVRRACLSLPLPAICPSPSSPPPGPPGTRPGREETSEPQATGTPEAPTEPQCPAELLPQQ